jgi:hypothetical protein
MLAAMARRAAALFLSAMTAIAPIARRIGQGGSGQKRESRGRDQEFAHGKSPWNLTLL